MSRSIDQTLGSQSFFPTESLTAKCVLSSSSSCLAISLKNVVC